MANNDKTLKFTKLSHINNDLSTGKVDKALINAVEIDWEKSYYENDQYKGLESTSKFLSNFKNAAVFHNTHDPIDVHEGDVQKVEIEYENETYYMYFDQFGHFIANPPYFYIGFVLPTEENFRDLVNNEWYDIDLENGEIYVDDDSKDPDPNGESPIYVMVRHDYNLVKIEPNFDTMFNPNISISPEQYIDPNRKYKFYKIDGKSINNPDKSYTFKFEKI